MSEGTPQPLGTIIIREASEPANFASKRQPLGARSLCWVRGGRFVLFFFFSLMWEDFCGGGGVRDCWFYIWVGATRKSEANKGGTRASPAEVPTETSIKPNARTLDGLLTPPN